MFARLFPIIALAVFAGFASLPAAAADPSFDCEGAKQDVEKLVCQDDELAALDVAVTRAFANAIGHAPANLVQQMKVEQSAWRRQLMRCDAADDLRACALAAYQARIEQL